MHITLNNVTADYELGPIRKTRVLHHINLSIRSGSYTALVGHTGSGKSSLLKTLNGLLLPAEGHVQVGETVIAPNERRGPLKELRRKVGMVFQFPESQLFAETILEDICFGPRNFGASDVEAVALAKEAAALVGLGEDLLSRSPFTLSGGQKRRAAIAGILAMKPEVLVLDEPAAGLDPKGKKEIMTLIATLHREWQLTTLLVTHDMNDAAEYADDLIVMHQGKVVLHEPVKQAFTDPDRLAKWKVELPDARSFQLQLENKIGERLPNICLTVEQLADALAKSEAT